MVLSAGKACSASVLTDENRAAAILTARTHGIPTCSPRWRCCDATGAAYAVIRAGRRRRQDARIGRHEPPQARFVAGLAVSDGKLAYRRRQFPAGLRISGVKILVAHTPYAMCSLSEGRGERNDGGRIDLAHPGGLVRAQPQWTGDRCGPDRASPSPTCGQRRSPAALDASTRRAAGSAGSASNPPHFFFQGSTNQQLTAHRRWPPTARSWNPRARVRLRTRSSWPGQSARCPSSPWAYTVGRTTIHPRWCAAASAAGHAPSRAPPRAGRRGSVGHDLAVRNASRTATMVLLAFVAVEHPRIGFPALGRRSPRYGSRGRMEQLETAGQPARRWVSQSTAVDWSVSKGPKWLSSALLPLGRLIGS